MQAARRCRAMNDQRKTDENGQGSAERFREPCTEPEVVRFADWVRRRKRCHPINPDDQSNGPDPGPSAA
jgi:hypothetical protein